MKLLNASQVHNSQEIISVYIGIEWEQIYCGDL